MKGEPEMRNSNFGYTFFSTLINFLTGRLIYSLISNKEETQYNRYDPDLYIEKYTGSFQTEGYNELLFSEIEGSSQSYSIITKAESHPGCRQLSSEVPEQFSLSQNFPNPFKAKTMINYQCPMSCFVSIKVYNVMWKEIATIVYENQSPGTYQLEFDGSEIKEGIYFYRMDTESFSDTKKMFIEKHHASGKQNNINY